ncbi:hypothetical protein BDR07DRAFT_1482166 [Suillus spraguei]|nr:hypothetical protein BDR07DRAFT_1482166 [Suillus spraguei]
MPTTEFYNTAMGDAAEQIMKILAVEIRDLMVPGIQDPCISVTTILPILLSAAMVMLEHLDVVQQSFASAPAWAKIRTDDPRIQQHPLKEKARSITVARSQPTLVVKASTGIASVLALAKCIPIVAGQTKTLKCLKVTPESVSPMQNAPKEDIKMDTDCQELVPPCDGCIKDVAPQAPNFKPVAVVPGTNLNVLMPKPNLLMTEDMLVSDNDAAIATTTTTLPPLLEQIPLATSVPPITTLSLEGETPPPAAQLLSLIKDPAIKSVSTAPQQQMDVDDSGDGLMKLKAKNTTATEQLNAMQARITSQDAALLELQGLDQQLRRAQDQLGQQECTTTALQDAYNAICQCLTGQPHSLSSPFASSLYVANPMYGCGQSMVPVGMGQMQAMEGLYFNLPSSVGNISSGSMLGGPTTGPSVTNIAGSSRTGGDTMAGAGSGVAHCTW